MSVTGLSPEERVERVRMALAEAGYPDVPVRPDSYDDGPLVVTRRNGVELAPEAAVFRAFATVGETGLACWPCWEADTKESCTHDPLTSPWPEVVR